jgi:PASTA domain-containing protein
MRKKGTVSKDLPISIWDDMSLLTRGHRPCLTRWIEQGYLGSRSAGTRLGKAVDMALTKRSSRKTIAVCILIFTVLISAYQCESPPGNTVSAKTSGDETAPVVGISVLEVTGGVHEGLGRWGATNDAVTGSGPQPAKFPSNVNVLVAAQATDDDGGAKAVVLETERQTKTCTGPYKEDKVLTQGLSANNEPVGNGDTVDKSRTVFGLIHNSAPLNSSEPCWSRVTFWATGINYSGKSAETRKLEFIFDTRPGGGREPVAQTPSVMVQVPNVVGNTAAKAYDLLEARGLKYVTANLSPTVWDSNLLIVQSQDPVGGTSVEKGSTVGLNVEAKQIAFSKITLFNESTDKRPVQVFSHMLGTPWKSDTLAFNSSWTLDIKQNGMYEVAAVDPQMPGCTAADPQQTECWRWYWILPGSPNGIPIVQTLS